MCSAATACVTAWEMLDAIHTQSSSGISAVKWTKIIILRCQRVFPLLMPGFYFFYS